MARAAVCYAICASHMTLAFLIYKYFPYGGLQRDFLRVLHELCQRGHRCRVYCVSWQGDVPDDVEVLQAPPVLGSRVRRNRRFAKWVRERLEKQPVSGVIGFNKMPGLDMYFAGDTCFLAEATENRSFLYRLGLRFRHFAAWEKAVFARGGSTEILLLTARESARFQRYYQTERERMHLLPPGVARDRCHSASSAKRRAQTRAKLGLSPNALVLLFVGSGFVTKGLDRAIRALAALHSAHPNRDVRLVIAGQRSAGRMGLLARRHRVRKRIEFLGGRDDVPDLLQAADILVHPARSEAAGVILLEALVAGLPVVATDICGYISYIDDAAAGKILATPFKQSELNAALAELVDSRLRETYSSRALEFAQRADLFSLHETAAGLIERQLAARSRGG